MVSPAYSAPGTGDVYRPLGRAPDRAPAIHYRSHVRTCQVHKILHQNAPGACGGAAAIEEDMFVFNLCSIGLPKMLKIKCLLFVSPMLKNQHLWMLEARVVMCIQVNKDVEMFIFEGRRIASSSTRKYWSCAK